MPKFLKMWKKKKKKFLGRSPGLVWRPRRNLFWEVMSRVRLKVQ